MPVTRRRRPGLSGYLRAEAFTFLTVPEWYIVYSTDEYAAFVRRQPPSAFPYLGAIAPVPGAPTARPATPRAAATRSRWAIT